MWNTQCSSRPQPGGPQLQAGRQEANFRCESTEHTWGRSLVGRKFKQEAQEANFRWALRMHRLGSELPRPVKPQKPIDVDRYGLVRVRENAESIAFYGGESSEERLLARRLGAAIANYAELLIASRNLQFFTSFYRQAPSPD